MMRSGHAAIATLVLVAISACGRRNVDPFVLPDGTPIVLVGIDTLGANHLGCYGCALETSPTIDAFARSARRGDRARTRVRRILGARSSSRVSNDGGCESPALSAGKREGGPIARWDATSMIESSLPHAERSSRANESQTNERLFALLDDYERTSPSRPLSFWSHYFAPHRDEGGCAAPASFRDSFVGNRFAQSRRAGLPRDCGA